MICVRPLTFGGGKNPFKKKAEKPRYSLVDIEVRDSCLRETLNKRASRLE
jgi:hypothetical protein